MDDPDISHRRTDRIDSSRNVNLDKSCNLARPFDTLHTTVELSEQVAHHSQHFVPGMAALDCHTT